MELAKSVIAGLNHIMDRELFDKLTTLSCKTLLDDKFPLDKHLQNLDSSSVDIGDVKMVVRCVMTVLVVSARHDCDSTSLATYLDDHSVWEGAVSCLTNMYNTHRSELRVMLSHINNCGSHSHAAGGTLLPHVIDADWRMEYVVKNNELERLNEVKYLVNLETDGGAAPGAPGDHASCGDGHVEFVCSVEQLQDLVGKLKDACKAVERAASAGAMSGGMGK